MEKPSQTGNALATAVPDDDQAPGHWVLARLGKRVLRPGGRELTGKLIEALGITSNDDVVEFAPGLGFTAKLVLARKPHSYIGIERDEAAANEARQAVARYGGQIVIGDAASSGLPSESASVVYGEAMLTMQTDARKQEIIHEARRLLRSGGRYGIHELCLLPNDLSDEAKHTIRRELAQAIRVNARPLTASEWQALLGEAGFCVEYAHTNPMHLLEPGRIIADEGFFRALGIALRLLNRPAARQRVLEMRQVFKRHTANLCAVALVGRK